MTRAAAGQAAAAAPGHARGASGEAGRAPRSRALTPQERQRLKKAVDERTRELARLSTAQGRLRQEQARVLELLHSEPGLTRTQVGERFSWSKSKTWRLLRSMMSQRLIVPGRRSRQEAGWYPKTSEGSTSDEPTAARQTVEPERTTAPAEAGAVTSELT
jgi:hypothetical protein